jgi:hypothetical protein
MMSEQEASQPGNFLPSLQKNYQELTLVYFLKVLSRTINALVHSNKLPIEAVFGIVLGQADDGLF